MMGSNASDQDARVLQRVDSFGIPVVVSTLVAGFSVQLFGEAKEDSTKVLTATAVICEIVATTLFSTIAFAAKQTYNCGSASNNRTVAFLHNVSWVTTAALTLYTIGLLTFGIGFLIQATRDTSLGFKTAVHLIVWLSSFISWLGIKLAYKGAAPLGTWELDPKLAKLTALRNESSG
ncbi:unnamed protein product [Ectocarpus sp. 12 AP-2014]